MGKFSIKTSFELENFESVNKKAQDILKQVSENSKIKLDFSDGMSLNKMQKQINKLQDEIIKTSQQSSKLFTKSFDDINRNLQTQIEQIKNNLKSIYSDVDVSTQKDSYGKITGAIAKYKDETGKLIEKNYELGKSFKTIGENGKYIEKLKLVDDSDLKNQNKLLDFLDEERKKIEQLTNTTAKVKLHSDSDGNISKATITYTDNLSRAVTETYKLNTVTQDLENTIRKTMSFEKTGTTYTDNIAKSLKTVEQYEKTIDKLSTKNIELGGGKKTEQFATDLKKVNSLLNEVKSSGQSMTQSTKKNIDTLINAMNLENKEIKKNNDEMKKKQKIMKDAPIAIQGYENKIVSLKNKYKELVKEADLSKLREEMAKLSNSKDPENYARQLKMIRNEYEKVENTVKGRGISTGQKDKMGIFSAIGQAMTKFPIWIGATTAWMEVIRKAKDGIGFIADLDKAQTNIAMITDMNKEKVKELTDEYSKLAGELHTTTKEIMGGAEEFLRAGRSVEETKGLLKASTIGSAISGQSNDAMSEQLIAISNGFRMPEQAKKNGEDFEKYAMHIVDVLSTLDNESATSFQEIATALTRTASSAQMAGVDFDTLSQYIAVVSATSRKSAESIGESFKTIFARFQDIKQNKKVDELGEEISNVEGSFKKIGINIRKDKTHFKDFSDVLTELKSKWSSLNDLEKTDIAKSLAGTRQRENLLVLLENMDKMKESEIKGKQLEGSAERKYNEDRANSIQGKTDDLKHAWEELYRTVINSDFIKKIVQGATTLVKWFDQLIQSTGGLKGSFLILLPSTILLTKNFKTMFNVLKAGKDLNSVSLAFKTLFLTTKKGEIAFGGLTTKFSVLKSVMLKSVTTPTGLAFLAITAAVIGATTAITKYIAKQKRLKEENEKLKQSQDQLNKAMAKGDVKGIKESIKPLEEQQKKLDELFKKKKELEKGISDNPNKNNMGMLNKVDSDIKEITDQLDGLGYTIDETTGKIFQLESAKNVSAAFETIEKVKKEREERVGNINAILSEIDEYNNLSSAENLNAEQKERLTQLAQNLKGKIKDLKIQTDEHGNAVIINTDLLGKNKEMLIKERIQILKNKDAIWDEAKTSITAEIAKTNNKIKEVSKRIGIIKSEEEALKKKADSVNNVMMNNPLTKVPIETYGNQVNKKHQESKDELNNTLKQLEQLQKDVESKKSSLKALEELEHAKPKKTESPTPDFTPTDPEKTKKSTDAIKENTGVTDKNREAVNKAKEAVKQFELALKSLEIQMTKNNIALGRLYEHSDKYISKLKERQNLIKQEIELNKKQIATNGQLANSLGAVGGSYINGMGNSIGEQVVRNAQQYLGRPYKWGGSNPSESFDCSGLVQYVYKQVGIQLNRTTYDQVKQGTPVAKNQLQVGDAVFFGSPSAPHHVGIYMGNGQYIHAPKTGDVIKVSSLNSRSDYATARRYASGGAVSRTTSSNYSGKYASYINEAAAKYGVSAALIAAIIKAESDFNPNVRSGAGAMGLMQLMPETARELGVRNPFDPRQNIMGGTQEIAKYLKKYNGNLDLALAAYNAGMGAVQKYGGVPPYKETKDYIPKVKKYMKEYGGSESSIHSTIDEQMDLIGKSMDLEKKNLELQEELNKINIQILEARLGQFDDKVKSIDRTITQLRTDVDLQNKNDINYVNYLSKIDDYTMKKLNVMKEKRAFLEKEMKSGIYDEKTIQMMRDKNSELGTEMLNVTKTIKDVSLELVTAKWEAIQQIYKENIEIISNELDRLNLHEEKNIKQIMILKNQLVEQDEANIKRITDLIRETNDIAYKYSKHFLLDKVREYNAELDKANTELEKHKKELEEVKKKIAEIKSTIEDKLREILTKTAELAKEQLDKVLKHFEETIDAELKKLDDAEKRNSYNEQKTEQLKTIVDLQEKIAKLATDDSEEGIARRLEYEKQLQEEMKKKTDLQMKHNNELKKEALNKQKEEKRKEIEKKKRDIDTRLDNVYLNLDARKALTEGYIEWINDKRIGIQDALLQFEDLFGKGLTSLGDKIKKELLEQLKAAQDLVNGIEKKDPDKILEEHKTKNVYGTGIDLANARKILGSLGYNYIDTSLVDKKKLHFGKDDIVVGDVGAINGVDRQDLNGAKRLGGQNRYETAAIIQLYSDIQSGRIKPINGIVYGTGSDLKNAIAWLSPLGYEFVDTSKINPSDVNFNPSDIILGGKGAKNGVGFDVEDVLRLGGKNRNDTYDKIRNYALNEMMKQAKNNYSPKANGGKVYGTGVDLESAKKYLTKLGYQFVDTKSVRDVQLTANDIVVGGGIDGKEQIYNSQVRWLFGKDRYDTEKEIANYANTMSGIQGYFKEGGTVDYTGKAFVHGSETSAETVFSARDSRKLYNLVHNIMPMNPFGYGFNKNLQPAMTTNNSNNITINFEVDKMYANEGEAKSFSSTIINNLKNWGKR